MNSSTTQKRRKRKGKQDSITTNSSSSSSIIDYNLDILILILTRLPLESLLVCKSVSKQWLSLTLISGNPHFVHRYALQNPRFTIPAGLLWYNRQYDHRPENDYISLGSSAPLRTLTFDEDVYDDGHIKIIQSCNGLLICSNCTAPGDNWHTSYYIFNPFTNMRRILPRSQLRKRGFTDLCNVSLAFDPLKSPYYKVICFWRKCRFDQKYQIEIYSSETSCWKPCGEEYCFPFRHFTSGVFWNGSLNWVYKQGSLVYFDIDREVTAEVGRHLPEDWQSWRTEYKIECFDTYEGHLRFLEVSLKASTFSLFHMDIEYTGWNLKYRVDLEGLKISYPRLCSGYNVLYVDEGEESPNLVILIHDRKVISYDHNKVGSQKLYDITGTNSFVLQFSGVPYNFYNVYKYIESLAHV